MNNYEELKSDINQINDVHGVSIYLKPTDLLKIDKMYRNFRSLSFQYYNYFDIDGFKCTFNVERVLKVVELIKKGLHDSKNDSKKKNDLNTVDSKLDKFDLCFLEVAECISKLSKDPSTKIGAVITGKHRQIVSQGFNGFPRGVDDHVDRYSDKDTKYNLVVHAEANAIYHALQNGADINGSTIYVHGLPCCNECAKAIIQVGIKRVVQLDKKQILDSKWTESNKISRMMFEECGVEVVDV